MNEERTNDMTIQEILKACGVDDDSIQSITDSMKANKVFVAGEENLDVRYGKLKTDHEGSVKELNAAKARIAELEKSASGSNALQQQVEQLQAELQATKLDAAIKLGLLEAKATDVDYLAFKLKSKADEIKLDEKGEISGWEDKLAALKTQFPNQFAQESKNKVLENRLPDEHGDKPLSRDDILRKPYAERQRIFEENPDAFREAMNK